MSKLFIIGISALLFCFISIMLDNEKSEQESLGDYTFVKKIPLYFNIDNPNVTYIKNSDGKYEEVFLDG